MKTTLEDMIKLFDAIWKKDPFNGANSIINSWSGICKDNGWTSEEFDEELYKWQIEKRRAG